MRYHTSLEVNLGILGENFEKLQKIAPNNEIIFMIKANAYGHGLLPIANFCYQDLNVKNFGVASLGEAVELRKNLPSMLADIYVFSDVGLIWEDTRELFVEYNIIPVVASMDDLNCFIQEKSFSNMPLVLKFDTGMNRLGIEPDVLSEVVQKIKSAGRKRIDHLMTHFASSFIKIKDGDKTHKQYDGFKSIKKTLQGAGIEVDKTSCANSGAIEQNISLEESHIRPGLMLYGPGSFGSDQNWGGKIISSFETHVLKTKMIKKGTPVGYGGHVSHKDGLLVYIPVGYGDGILTSYTKADLEISGNNARILGRINMDLTALLFDPEVEGKFREGSPLKLWDHDPKSMAQLAKNTQTIPYQIFTAVSARIPRSYGL